MPVPYDAILLVSFGGPERREDVVPFLENVLRGRNVPHERMLAVAEHYYHFDGVSPINAQNRELIAALRQELNQHGIHLPVYWGNRNWHPLLPDTLLEMRNKGVRRALGFFTSAFSSYSGCRQYRENIAAARSEIGDAAPQVDKLRVFYNHPGFIQAMHDRVQAALDALPAHERNDAALYFTAHSVPLAMAANSRYEEQLLESCRLIGDSLGGRPWRLVYQSRSGPFSQPWLEPDILDVLKGHAAGGGSRQVVVAPLGFISDHMEVLYDLDTEARQLADELGLTLVRAATVGTHPRFVQMIRELIAERLTDDPQRLAIGQYGPSHDVCPLDCCLYIPQRPTERPS